MSERDVKMHGFQVEVGEPVLLIRGNDPLALELLTHRLAKLSADPKVPTHDVVAAAELTDRFRDWQQKKRTT